MIWWKKFLINYVKKYHVNEQLKNKNDEIISQNAKLLARLEKLENIAFKLQNNQGLKLSKGLWR